MIVTAYWANGDFGSGAFSSCIRAAIHSRAICRSRSRITGSLTNWASRTQSRASLPFSCRKSWTALLKVNPGQPPKQKAPPVHSGAKLSSSLEWHHKNLNISSLRFGSPHSQPDPNTNCSHVGRRPQHCGDTLPRSSCRQAVRGARIQGGNAQRCSKRSSIGESSTAGVL
jgi:hypothetical protein